MGLFYDKQTNEVKAANVTFFSISLFLLVIILLLFGAPAYGRYQRLQNEHNQTRVNDIKIAQTRQLVQVAEQTKQITIVNAHGIAASQKIINGTLTNQYLQYLAIDAQKAEVSSPNHTIIYVPAGDNGIPLVQTVNPQQ